MGCLHVVVLMGTTGVVVVNESADVVSRLSAVGVGAQVDFVVLDRSPETLDHDPRLSGSLPEHRVIVRLPPRLRRVGRPILFFVGSHNNSTGLA
jgi:hypothetical protein